MTRARDWFVLALVTVAFPCVAWAEDPVEPIPPNTFAEKIVDLVEGVGVTIGGAILLFSVLFLAIKVLLSLGRPQSMAETMQGFGWLCVAGAILGAVTFIAGVILGLGGELGK